MTQIIPIRHTLGMLPHFGMKMVEMWCALVAQTCVPVRRGFSFELRSTAWYWAACTG